MRLLIIRSIIIVFALAVVAIPSCKKQTVYEGYPAMLYVFNHLDDGINLYGNYSDSAKLFYSYGQYIPNRSNFSSKFENPVVRARYFASPDTLAKDLPVFDKQFTLENGKIYSLFLMGDQYNVDHLIIENHLKSYKGDSVTNMRVINTSNDQPISVNIKGDPPGSLIDNLSYKGITDFLEMKAGHTHPEYELEFRDAVSGELLLTFLVPAISDASGFLYKNWTLVFSGKRGVSDVNALNAGFFLF